MFGKCDCIWYILRRPQPRHDTSRIYSLAIMYRRFSKCLGHQRSEFQLPVQTGMSRRAWDVRCHAAGQAVVQFARGYHDQVDYAIKFYLDREAFVSEAALYASCSVPPTTSAQLPADTRPIDAYGCSTLAAASFHTAHTAQMPAAAAQFLPQVEVVCDGVSGELADPRGRPLPPCIVMEKGESLQDWNESAHPDLFNSLSVRAH